MASQDELTQRRIGQIGEVIGAVENVAETEGATALNVAEKRTNEAHDIIHRIAAILALEEGKIPVPLLRFLPAARQNQILICNFCTALALFVRFCQLMTR